LQARLWPQRLALSLRVPLMPLDLPMQPMLLVPLRQGWLVNCFRVGFWESKPSSPKRWTHPRR
jgi:hypothetical protein